MTWKSLSVDELQRTSRPGPTSLQCPDAEDCALPGRSSDCERYASRVRPISATRGFVRCKRTIITRALTRLYKTTVADG